MSRHGRTVAALVFGCALLCWLRRRQARTAYGRNSRQARRTRKAEASASSRPRQAAAPTSRGIRANDVIIAINGTSVRELDYQTIVERLRGPVGSTVQLDVFREGEVSTVAVMRQAYTR